ATGGDLAASRRYREVHRRFGLGDELRAVARSANATWGMGCINRADDVRAFSAEEVRFVAAIAQHLGMGLRRSLSRKPANAEPLKVAGVATGRVAVVLEPADRAELMPLLLALHGLTERERDVTELIVAGLSTDEIATRLHISRHTLRDHVKVIFAKVGVSSRPELTAALAPEPLAA